MAVRLHKKRKSRCGETAGDATAVMCCCPCTVIKLLVLALYKLPARICRATGNKKKKKNRQHKKRKQSGVVLRKPAAAAGGVEVGEAEVTAAVVETEREMLERFNGGGFWRTGSR